MIVFRDQERAQAAYKAVKAMDTSPPHPQAKKYGILCLRLPTLIMNNGLCQTLAFFEAKAGKGSEYKQVMSDLAVATKLADSGDALAIKARNEQGPGYMRMTAESLRCALYFKRYSEAVLRVALTDDPDDEVGP